MKKSICSVKGCPFEGRYCRNHPAGSLAPVVAIKKESKKRAEVKKKVYLPIVREMLTKEPNCRVKSTVCTGKAQGLHHMKGRVGDDYTDKRFLLPCCNACNSFLEQNPLWGRNHGFLLSKHSKQ